jgi:mannosyltransferase OCH1-like enzyme
MIPKLIHQIYGLKDPGPVPKNLADCKQTWIQQNPDWSYKLWNREDIEDLLHGYPKWQTAFHRLDHWVEQCDFARYVIVYHYGGVYADLDTVCQTPAKEWTKYNGLVVGLEADVDDYEKAFHRLARNKQYCQWTFASVPRHPALYELIEYIANITSQSCFKEHKILNTTGPGAFTDIVQNAPNVLRLPIAAFAGGQAHSQSPPTTDPGCYVVHKFEGSWKIPGYLRPVKKLWSLIT